MGNENKRRKGVRPDRASSILEGIGEEVCDSICTRLDGIGDDEEAESICNACGFGKKYDELAGILVNIDEEYLEICRENDRIRRRLELYDLYSDMS